MDAAAPPANATSKGENKAQPDNISTDQLHNQEKPCTSLGGHNQVDKGKDIIQSTNDDALKKIMPYIEEGGLTPNLSSLKHFRKTEEGPMTIEEAQLQLQETKRLVDLKAAKDKS
ncbi:hypothetical protein Tco_0557235 [Tanacetum coccineum]